MSQLFDWAYKLGLLAALSAQAFFAIRWTVAGIIHYHETQRFITNMRTNHLPHIYRNLEALCDAAGIKFTEPRQDSEENGEHPLSDTRGS